MKRNPNFELVFVLRRADGDCSNHGATSKHSFLYMFRDSVPLESIEEWCESGSIDKDMCIYLKETNGYTWAEPCFKRERSEGIYVAGGNFVHTSNAEFARMTGHSYPISVHDRFESWEAYNFLSI